jgi:hypothetical protein
MSGADHYLYFGNGDYCSQALQNEWLYRVTDPASPVDLTPPPGLIDGQLTGYWGWYYGGNPTGLAYHSPLMGRVANGYFYRAARSIFDIHQLVSAEIFADSFESGDTGNWSSVGD